MCIKSSSVQKPVFLLKEKAVHRGISGQLLARLPGLELGLPPPEGGVMSTSLQAPVNFFVVNCTTRARIRQSTLKIAPDRKGQPGPAVSILEGTGRRCAP